MRRAQRGATIQGCLVMTFALALITTLAIYYAQYMVFHLTVAGIALAGCLVMAARDRRAEAAAFALIALPASISFLLGYLGHMTPDHYKGTTGLLYAAGPILYIALAVFLAMREERKNPRPPESIPKG